MEIRAHTTPENRQALKEYLRNRRLTSSIHLTIATLTLGDLEEALRLLQGIHHPNATWTDEVEAFLAKCASSHAPNSERGLLGFLEGA